MSCSKILIAKQLCACFLQCRKGYTCNAHAAVSIYNVTVSDGVNFADPGSSQGTSASTTCSQERKNMCAA